MKSARCETTSTHRVRRVFAVEAHDRDDLRAATAVSVVGVLLALALARFGLSSWPDLHPPLHRLGVMDPLCGMTRAVRYLALLRVRKALHYNPASPLLPLATVALWSRSLHGWRTGHWIRVRVIPTDRRVVGLAVAVGLVLLEIHQQMNATLLR